MLLILSSIALVFIHEFKYGDVANGVLMYVAQAFLLAGSIFGLDLYVHNVKSYITKRLKEQQPTEHHNQQQPVAGKTS